MKIALNHTRYDRHGGVERFLCHLANYLVARGHEVHFFGAQSGEGRNEEVVFHRVPRIGGTRTLRVLSFAYFSAQMLRKEKFDIIQGNGKTYFQDVYRDGSGSRAAYDEAQGRSPLARWSPGRRAQLWIDRRKYRPENYEAVIAISEVVKSQVVRDYGVPPEEIRVIHNGADIRRFSAENRRSQRKGIRRELEISEEATVVLLVASDLERKGAEVLIRALVRVPELILVIAGDEVRTPRFRELAKSLGVGSRVRFLGRRTDVERVHGVADVFALLSRFDAIANAALEAMASGLPVLVSEKDGACELVRPGENGFVVADPTDVPGVASNLERLLRDRDERERMGCVARETAESISLERQLGRYVELYEQVLEERRRRGILSPTGQF